MAGRLSTDPDRPNDGRSPTGWRLGRVAGVPIRIRVSTLLTFALLWLLLFPQLSAPLEESPTWVAGAVTTTTAMAFLASVVLHEVAHALAARLHGLEVAEVSIFLLGGVTRLSSEPSTPRDEYAIAVVGPLTNLLLGAVMLALAHPLGTGSVPGGLLTFVGQVNAAIGVFNLLPGHPLDGGVLLRSGFWAITGDRVRAAQLSARSGMLLAYVLIAAGVVGGFVGPRIEGDLGLFWLAIIGLFVLNSARTGLVQAEVRSRLAGVTAGTLSRPTDWDAEADWTVARVVSTVTRSQNHGLVRDASGDAVGVFGPDDLAEVPSGSWDHLTLGEVMQQLAGSVDVDDEVTGLLDRVVRAPDDILAVTAGGSPIGILRHRDVLERLRGTVHAPLPT